MKFNRKELAADINNKARERVWNMDYNRLSYIMEGYKQGDLVNKNLEKILDIPCEYVSDPAAGSTSVMNGLADIYSLFGTSNNLSAYKMAAKPFAELGRRPGDHFLMYCISTGMTSNQLLELAKDQPKQAVLDLLETKKKEFFEMVMDPKEDTRVNKCAEMYKNYLEKIPRFANHIFDFANAGNLHDAAVYKGIIGNTQSILFQTLTLDQKGDTPRPEMQQKLIDKVNEITQGSPYTLENTYAALAPISAFDHANHQWDTQHGQAIESKESAQMQIYARLQALQNHSHFMMTHEEPYSLMTEEYGTQIMSSFYVLPDMQELYADRALSDLKDELANNHILNAFGNPKDNSKEYNDVIQAITDYQAGNASTADVKKACRTYLDARTPSTPKGQERYSLILEVYHFANTKEKALQKEAERNAASEIDRSMELSLGLNTGAFERGTEERHIADNVLVAVQDNMNKFFCPLDRKGKVNKKLLDQRIEQLLMKRLEIFKSAGKTLAQVSGQLEEINPADGPEIRAQKANRIVFEGSKEEFEFGAIAGLTSEITHSFMVNYPTVDGEDLSGYIKQKMNDLTAGCTAKFSPEDQAFITNGRKALTRQELNAEFTPVEQQFKENLAAQNKAAINENARQLMTANHDQFAAMGAQALASEQNSKLRDMEANDLKNLHDPDHKDSKSYKAMADSLKEINKVMIGKSANDPAVKAAKAKAADAAILYMQGHWTKRGTPLGKNRFEFALKLLNTTAPEKGRKVKEYIQDKGEKRRSISEKDIKAVAAGTKKARRTDVPAKKASAPTKGGLGV